MNCACPTDQSPGSSQSNGSKGITANAGGIPVWAWIVVAAAVLILVAIIVAVIIVVTKKKSSGGNNYNRFTYY